MCSKALTDHILLTLTKYRVLPPEHQQNILVLMNRVELYKALYNFWPDGPDLVNPPLDVPGKLKGFLSISQTLHSFCFCGLIIQIDGYFCVGYTSSLMVWVK